MWRRTRLEAAGSAELPAFSPATNMVYITDAGPGVPGIAAGLVALRVTSNCLSPAGVEHASGWERHTELHPDDRQRRRIRRRRKWRPDSRLRRSDRHRVVAQQEASYAAAATFAAPIVAGGSVYAGSWSRLSGGGVVGAFALPTTPVLSVSPQSLSFATAAGSNPPPAIINVANGGGGALSFSAASDSPAWLSVVARERLGASGTAGVGGSDRAQCRHIWRPCHRVVHRDTGVARRLSP